MAEALSSLLKSRTALQLENIALRHQIGVLQRSAKKRLQLHNSDRLFLVGLSQVWSDWRSVLVIVKPETVIAWHRKAFRLFWTWKVQHGKVRNVVNRARTPGDITGSSRTDPPHELRESPLGSTAHSPRAPEARHRYRRVEREQVERGPIVSIAEVGGLHHRYERRVA